MNKRKAKKQSRVNKSKRYQIKQLRKQNTKMECENRYLQRHVKDLNSYFEASVQKNILISLENLRLQSTINELKKPKPKWWELFRMGLGRM